MKNISEYKDEDFDAELYEWEPHYHSNITGILHNDRTGRWKNGTRIYTSSVKHLIEDDEGNTVGVQTRNTLYRLISTPYPEDKENDVGLKTNVGCILK